MLVLFPLLIFFMELMYPQNDTIGVLGTMVDRLIKNFCKILSAGFNLVHLQKNPLKSFRVTCLSHIDLILSVIIVSKICQVLVYVSLL